MSYNYAIRVTLPYADCSGILRIWSDRCKSFIAYQHDADEEVSKTHVHIGIVGSEVKHEALKRMWVDCPGKGNEFWSWKEWQYEEVYDANKDKYLSYMTKGCLEPVFVKNFSEELVERSRQDWVEPVKADKTGDASEYDIVKILSKYDNDKFVTQYARDHVEPKAINAILERVRKDSFKFLYAKKRIVPNAGHYKIIASSVFMRLCERLEREDEAIEALQNLWY